MDPVSSLILCFLEATFIFITIILLHSQQKNIGTAPLYMAMGLLFLFGHFVAAADFRVVLYKNLEFQLGASVFFLSYLAGLLLIYIHNGTLATQRMIIGSFALFGIFFYLAEITHLQSNWVGYSLAKGQSVSALDILLNESMHSMMALLISHLAVMFFMPITYSRLQNWGARRLICIIGALFFAQGLDLLIYSSFFHHEIYFDKADFLSGAILSRGIFSVWLGVIIHIYIGKYAGEAAPHNTLDIVFAFFGAYGKSKKLEEVLLESEDRYRQILQNANEMIMLLSPSGKVLDANSAAADLLKKYIPDYDFSQNFFEQLQSTEKIYDEKMTFADKAPSLFHAELAGENGTKASLACSLSEVRLKNEKILLLIARDVTKEIQLQEEKDNLSAELAHSQRMEALGKLAGGIAHDFNNHIHAILGHVDLLLMTNDFENNPKAIRNLEKISSIAEQAGKLTSQLLGFARKGKFYATNLNMADVINHTLSMITVSQSVQISIKTDFPDEKIFVRGDNVQLSQVLLNLILNAIDAMEKSVEKNLTITLDRAVKFAEKIEHISARKDWDFGKYCCIAVADSGIGISEDLQKKVFEPFFTTKPVGAGTGMGLSMVYGTIRNHGGFVFLESKEGEGATFYLLLPLTENQ